jgi:hypothetical protein
MKLKDLKTLLAEFPDDADVSISLDHSGTALEIADIAVLYSNAGSDEVNRVYLADTPADDAPQFDGQVRLGLPEEFYALCQQCNVAPQTVLQGFIADLCALRSRADGPRPDGLVSRGSDERMLARHYFARCGYEIMAEI